MKYLIQVGYIRDTDASYDNAMAARGYAYGTNLELLPGDVITVPVGKSDKLRRAIVQDVTPFTPQPFNVKEVGVDELVNSVRVVGRDLIAMQRKGLEEKEEATEEFFQL